MKISKQYSQLTKKNVREKIFDIVIKGGILLTMVDRESPFMM